MDAELTACISSDGIFAIMCVKVISLYPKVVFPEKGFYIDCQCTFAFQFLSRFFGNLGIMFCSVAILISHTLPIGRRGNKMFKFQCC